MLNQLILSLIINAFDINNQNFTLFYLQTKKKSPEKKLKFGH